MSSRPEARILSLSDRGGRRRHSVGPRCSPANSSSEIRVLMADGSWPGGGQLGQCRPEAGRCAARGGRGRLGFVSCSWRTHRTETRGPSAVSSRQQGARRSLTRLAGPSGDRGSWLGARRGRVVVERQEAAASAHGQGHPCSAARVPRGGGRSCSCSVFSSAPAARPKRGLHLKGEVSNL